MGQSWDSGPEIVLSGQGPWDTDKKYWDSTEHSWDSRKKPGTITKKGRDGNWKSCDGIKIEVRLQ